MTYSDVMAYYGTPERVAAALGVRVQTVLQWRRYGGTLPRGREWELWAITRGGLTPAGFAEAMERGAAVPPIPREPEPCPIAS